MPRWRPYNSRTHFKRSWNDTRLSNLQKLEPMNTTCRVLKLEDKNELLLGGTLQWAMPIGFCKAALSNALAVAWSQKFYQWTWYHLWIINLEWKAAWQAAYVLNHEWKAALKAAYTWIMNFNFKIWTTANYLEFTEKICPNGCPHCQPKTSNQEGNQPSLFIAQPGSKC